MITVQYFGVLKDRVGMSQEQVAWETGDTTLLLESLRGRNDIWAEALAADRVFRVVVNDEIVYDATPLAKGDRVAILPPVTGG